MAILGPETDDISVYVFWPVYPSPIVLWMFERHWEISRYWLK